VTSGGTYNGTGSTTNVIQVIQTGDPSIVGPGEALVKYSTDGGVTWDDNGGAGFVVSDAAPLVMSNGVEASFTGGSNLTAGDKFRIDVADPLIESAQDAVLRINGINVTKSSEHDHGPVRGRDAEPEVRRRLEDGDRQRLSVTR
jgi:hypothetical protein